MTKTSLSVLVPVYNEEHLVYASLERLAILETSDLLERIEVIVVDDCSTDRSRDVLDRFRIERTGDEHSKIHWTFLHHPTNAGKGQAIRTALAHATCDISVIHDADLEYHRKICCASSKCSSRSTPTRFTVRALPVEPSAGFCCSGTSSATSSSRFSLEPRHELELERHGDLLQGRCGRICSIRFPWCRTIFVSSRS